MIKMKQSNLAFIDITSKEKFLMFLEKAANQNDKNHDSYLDAISILDDEVLAIVLKNLKKLSFTDERRFLALVHTIDENMNPPSKQQTNRYRKLMTILASTYYIKNIHYDNYSNRELALLADISCYEDKKFYDEAYLKYPRKLLQTILKLSDDYMMQDDFMILVEKLYSENKTLDEIITYLSEKNIHELLHEAFEYEKKLVGEFDGTNRI